MAASSFIMPLQENNPETNTSPSPKKKRPLLKAQFRNQFVFCGAAPFIFVLVLSYTFLENGPVVMLMGYLTASWNNENLKKAAAITNLQDYLSDFFEVIVEQISEAYIGCFTMITFCTAVSTMALMLLWISATGSTKLVYVAIFLLAFGQAGKSLLEEFLKDQLDEKVRAKMESKPKHKNSSNKEDIMRTKIWWYPAMCAGIILTVSIIYNIKNIFSSAALLMVGTYVIFYFGCARHSHITCKNLPAKSTH